MGSRTKNTVRNIIWGMVNKSLSIITPFISRTIIIYTLGNDYLGLSSLFTSILQVLNLSELGFGSAVIYSMYKPAAENDYVTLRALLAYYKRIYSIIGISILVLGGVITPFIPRLISGGCPSDINIYFLYFLYLINMAVSYILFAYKNSLIEVYQRNDINSNILSVLNILKCILQVITLVVFNNYYAFVAVEIVITVSRNIAIHYITKIKYPELFPDGVLAINLRKNIRKQVSGLVIQRVCSTTRNSFDSIFISAFLGLTAIALYGNYYYIMSACHTVLLVFTTAMQASVGNSLASESIDKNYNDMKKFIHLYAWISSNVVTILTVTYQVIMIIWVGESRLLEFETAALFAAYLYVLSMGDVYTVYYHAAGLWWEGKYRALLESITNLILNYVFIKMLGLNGVILGTLISLFVINFLYGSTIIFKHYFSMYNAKEFYFQHILYALTVLNSSFICCFICRNLVLNNIYVELFVRIIICTLVNNTIWFVFWGKTKIFKCCTDYLRRIKR